VRSTAERSGGYETDELPGRLTRSKIGGGIQVEPDTDNSKGTEKVFLVHHLYHCHWKQETKAYHLEFFMFIIAYSVDPMSFFMRICGLFGDEARFGMLGQMGQNSRAIGMSRRNIAEAFFSYKTINITSSGV